MSEDQRTYVGYWGDGDVGAYTHTNRQNVSTAERIALQRFLDNPTDITQWRGYSSCRVCGGLNGSRCYATGPFVWPEGYLHYVLEHGVRPPESMIAYAMEAMSGPVPGLPRGDARSRPPQPPGPDVSTGTIFQSLVRSIAMAEDLRILQEVEAEVEARAASRDARIRALVEQLSAQVDSLKKLLAENGVHADAEVET